MVETILDAWAIMAWLKGQQPASEHVRFLLDAARLGNRTLLMNIVNLGEVFYLCAKAKDLAYGEQVLEALRTRVVSVSAGDELVMLAATLKSRHSISYADGFAAATAILREVPLVTGDPELRAIAPQEERLRIEWIGT